MAKKNNMVLTLFLVVLFFIALQSGMFAGLFSVFVFEDFFEYDPGFGGAAEFNQWSTNPLCVDRGDGRFNCENDVWISKNVDANSELNQHILVKSHSSFGAASIESVKDLSGLDVLVKGRYGGAFSGQIFINDFLVLDVPCETVPPSGASCSPGQQFTLQADHSAKQRGNYLITGNLNGKDILPKQVDIGDSALNVEVVVGSFNAPAAGFESGSVTITDFSYRIPSCVLGDDEVLVYDDFAQGSVVTVNDLKYVPLRYCLNVPPLIINSGGIISDDHGEFLIDLVEATPITVNDEVLRILYVTKFVEGTTLQCPIGQAMNTQTNTCQFYAATADSTFQCVEDEDCWLPTNCGTSITTTCSDNVCVYNGGTCTDDELLNQLAVLKSKLQNLSGPQIIFGGPQEVNLVYSFTAQGIMKFGDLENLVFLPTFNCPVESGDVFGSPNPNSTCWNGRIMITGTDHDFTHTQKRQINDYLSLTYVTGGTYQQATQQISNANAQILMALKPSFLTIQPKQTKFFIQHNSASEAKFDVINNLNINFDGGYTIETQKGILQELRSTETTEKSIKSGTNEFSHAIDTSTLGPVTIKITPFIKAGDDLTTTVKGSQTAIFTYEVSQIVDKQPTITPPTQTPQDPPTEPPKDFENLFFIAIIILAAFLILITIPKMLRKR